MLDLAREKNRVEANPCFDENAEEAFGRSARSCEAVGVLRGATWLQPWRGNYNANWREHVKLPPTLPKFNFTATFWQFLRAYIPSNETQNVFIVV